MSTKRKKTTTTKTTTKVKLVKKLTALDKKHSLDYVNETGVLGAAYKIIYSVNDGVNTTKRKELAAKSIESIVNMQNNAASFNFNTEEEIAALHSSLNDLIYGYMNDRVPSNFEGMSEKRITEVMFLMLMTYCFTREHLQEYCAINKNNRVGMIIIYDCIYNELEDSLMTKLRLVPIDGLEKWMDVSNQFLAAENAEIIKA